MTRERWGRIKEIFEAALEQPPEARSSFLVEVCGGDISLRGEVELLLSGRDQGANSVTQPALAALALQGVLGARPRTFKAGKVVSGRFQIVRFIGRGGMGEVYEAKDLELGAHVALKTIRPEIAWDPRTLARFKQEIQLARHVTHRNVCRMYDLEHCRPDNKGQPDITFLTMELLEGETLAERLSRRGRVRVEEALTLVCQMGEGLAAAHEVGVVHRDFKPGNVMLVRQKASDAGASTPSQQSTQSVDQVLVVASPPPACLRAVITDFGLARVTTPFFASESSAPSLSVSGHLVGTPAYMAPEQLAGREATPAADIYALGLVMYEMVTGKRPFPDDILLGGPYQRLAQRPPSPRVHVPDLNPRLEQAILRCLEIEPAKRFESSRDFVVTLEALADPLGVTRTPPGTSPIVPIQASDVVNWGPANHKPEARVGRRRSLAAVVVFAIAATLFIWYYRHALLSTSWVEFLQNQIRRAAKVRAGDSILVADFENLSGDNLFDGTVSDLVARSLQQSRLVTVVSRPAAMEAARRTGRANITSIDANLARDISIRESYRALLAGQIVKHQSAYRIDVQLIDPRKGRVVLTESQGLTSSADLYDAVDQMVGRVRQRIGESLAQIEEGKRLAQVTTPSLAALTAYTHALDLFQAKDYYGSLAMARNAVALDPTFAMAHLLLAQIDIDRGDRQNTYREVDLARRNLDRVLERERHLILAFYRAVHYDEAGAAEEYRVLVEQDPKDIEALRGWADALSWTAQISKAAEVQRRVISLNPGEVANYSDLMHILIRLSRFDEALAVYKETQAHHLDSPQLHWAAGLGYQGLDDLEGARREFDLLHSTPDGYYRDLGQLCLAAVSLYEGKAQEAQRSLLTGPLADEAKRGMLVFVRLDLLARSYWIQGQIPLARSSTRRLIAGLRSDDSPFEYEEAGLLAVDVGDLDMARHCLATLQKVFEKVPEGYTESTYYSIRGALEAAAGNLDAAIESNRRALDLPIEYEAYVALGTSYGQKGDWSAAVAAYGQYLGYKGDLLRSLLPARWVIANLSLARAYRNAGRETEAKHYYDEFFKHWAHADAENPWIQTARIEYDKLPGQK